MLGNFNLRFVHKTFVIVVLPLAVDNRAEGQHLCVTCVETWVYIYDLKNKQQSSQWKISSPPQPKTTCQVQSRTKVMLTAFFDCESIVHYDGAAQSRTMHCHFHYKC